MRDSGVLLALVRFLEGSEIFRGSINFFFLIFFTKIVFLPHWEFSWAGFFEGFWGFSEGFWEVFRGFHSEF